MAYAESAELALNSKQSSISSCKRGGLKKFRSFSCCHVDIGNLVNGSFIRVSRNDLGVLINPEAVNALGPGPKVLIQEGDRERY
jgi:hypothetical protein